MQRNTRFALLAGLWVLLGVILVACRPESETTPSTSPGIGVEITSDSCPNLVVQAGQQVTWTNRDNNEHVVRHIPEAGSGQFDSGTLSPGDTFAFTFPESGQYSYACSADGGMTAMITVDESN